MPSTTYRAHDFMEAAGRLGTEVVVGTDQRQALEEATRERVLPLDFLHPEEAVRQIEAFDRKRPLDVLFGVDDETVLLAALASEALGLPANSVESVRAARSKWRLRERLREAGLPGPDYRAFPRDADPRAAAAEVGYPCVLKPTFLSASRGVIRADDPESFAAAFRRIAKLLVLPDLEVRGGEEAGRILVESFVPGEEVALEGLLVRGRLRVLALFDKPDPLEGPYFEETYYVTPSRLPAATQARIAERVGAAAAALGLEEGPVHAEARLRGGDCILIECAARSIGGLCSRTLRFGAGLALEEVLLRHALGLEVEPPQRETSAAAVLMLPIPRAGVLRGVDGVEAARAVRGVVEVDITIPIGHPVVPLPEGDRYLGFAFSRGETAAEAEGALREARELLRFDIS